MKRPRRVDLSKVNHAADDGRLLSSTFDIGVCLNCNSCHLDLKDPAGKVFATCLIPPEHFLEIAAKFCDFDRFVRGRIAAGKTDEVLRGKN